MHIFVSSFVWSGTCQFWWSNLSLVGFFSLYCPKKYSSTLFIIGISTLVLIFFIFYFYSWLFCRSFICFQFHLSIIFYQILYFSTWSLLFWFWFFFFSPFIKVLLVFNFIIQFKLMVLCFSIWPLFFYF
jgi:hypothetical protein